MQAHDLFPMHCSCLGIALANSHLAASSHEQGSGKRLSSPPPLHGPTASFGLRIKLAQLAGGLRTGNRCRIIAERHVHISHWFLVALAHTSKRSQSGYGSKLNHQGTAGFGPFFHLPGFHFGYPCLTHSLRAVSGFGHESHSRPDFRARRGAVSTSCRKRSSLFKYMSLARLRPNSRGKCQAPGCASQNESHPFWDGIGKHDNHPVEGSLSRLCLLEGFQMILVPG